MEFEKVRIIRLRDRLRNCYKFIHNGDKEKLGYLESTKTSEANPFLIALSKNLKERFGKNSSGNSEFTLRSIFFDDNKVTYDGDTIVNLELFCSEIEENIDKESSEIFTFFNIKKTGNLFRRFRTVLAYFFTVLSLPFLYFLFPLFATSDNFLTLSVLLILLQIISMSLIVVGFRITKRFAFKRNVIWSRNGIFSLGIILNLILLYAQFVGANYLMDNPNIFGTSFSENKRVFVDDPAGLGNGTTSINFNAQGANEIDFLDVNSLKTKDTLDFYVFIDYQNSTLFKLTEVKARISYTESGVSKTTRIRGTLSAKQGNSHTDQTEIINLPDSWEINILEVSQINTHREQCGEKYEYNIKLNANELTQTPLGVSLVDIDAHGVSSANGYSGACSQGHVVAKFQLIKK